MITGIDYQHPVLDGDPKSDLAASLLDAASKVILLPAMSDGIFQKEWEISDSSRSDYFSEPYAALLGHSAPKAYAQNFEVDEARERRYPNEDVIKNAPSDTRLPQGARRHEISLGTIHESQTFSSWTLVDITTNPQTITQAMSSLSPTKTSSQQWHNTAINYGSLSKRLSKQGVELILSSVLGGSLAFIGIVFLHRIVLRSLHEHNERSKLDFRPLAVDDLSSKKSGLRLTGVAEVSHFFDRLLNQALTD
jgi:hypothetical protein